MLLSHVVDGVVDFITVPNSSFHVCCHVTYIAVWGGDMGKDIFPLDNMLSYASCLGQQKVSGMYSSEEKL